MALEEDAYGTPPAARSSMMVVADDRPNDGDDGELLVDGGPDEYEGNDTAGAPRYAEGRIVISLGELRRLVAEVIKKSGGRYNLYTKHKKGGKRRKLGSHATKAGAERQERAIHANGG